MERIRAIVSERFDGIDDPEALKDAIAFLLAELCARDDTSSAGYLRMKPQRPVMPPKPHYVPVDSLKV